MPAYHIKDFKSGMDLRKIFATAPPGSLRMLRNAYITSGAEIEGRSAFVDWCNVPPESFGVISRNGLVYVVMPSGAPGVMEPTETDAGWIAIVVPPGVTFTKLADWDLFNSQFYLVMQGSDGKYYHYFNQVRVTDPMATSSSIRTYGSKMYGVDGRLLRFSAISDPTKWTPPSGSTNDGSGYIDLSAQDADSTNLAALEVYYDKMAIFSRLSTQFWFLDPDPSKNQFVQLLRQTGVVSSNGLTQFGSGDVMYLSTYGVRSLRVQNLTQTAGVTDIGTPIDEPMHELMQANYGTQYFPSAQILIQPRVGRMWVILPDRAFILSTFQEPAITALSMYDFPADVTMAVVATPMIILRTVDNKLYRFGGEFSDTYDNSLKEAILPAISCDNPIAMKRFHSFDVGAEGTWTMSVGLDPNNEDTEEEVATFTGTTFMNNEMTMPGDSTHISLRFRSTDARKVKLGNAVVVFDSGDDFSPGA